MLLKSVLFKAAPPIKPPSTFGLANSSFAFEGLQLPPYKMEIESAISEDYWVVRVSRINKCIASACAAVAVKPVPIAQIGSYAIVVCTICSGVR